MIASRFATAQRALLLLAAASLAFQPVHPANLKSCVYDVYTSGTSELANLCGCSKATSWVKTLRKSLQDQQSYFDQDHAQIVRSWPGQQLFAQIVAHALWDDPSFRLLNNASVRVARVLRLMTPIGFANQPMFMAYLKTLVDAGQDKLVIHKDSSSSLAGYFTKDEKEPMYGGSNYVKELQEVSPGEYLLSL